MARRAAWRLTPGRDVTSLHPHFSGWALPPCHFGLDLRPRFYCAVEWETVEATLGPGAPEVFDCRHCLIISAIGVIQGDENVAMVRPPKGPHKQAIQPPPRETGWIAQMQHDLFLAHVTLSGHVRDF